MINIKSGKLCNRKTNPYFYALCYITHIVRTTIMGIPS